MRTLELPRVNPILVFVALLWIGLFVLGLVTDDRPIMAVAVGGTILSGVGWWLVS